MVRFFSIPRDTDGNDRTVIVLGRCQHSVSTLFRTRRACGRLYASKSYVNDMTVSGEVEVVAEVTTHSPQPAGTRRGYGRTTSEFEPGVPLPFALKIRATLRSPPSVGATGPAYRLVDALDGQMLPVWIISPAGLADGATTVVTPLIERESKFATCLPIVTAFIFSPIESNDCSRRIPLSCRSKAIAQGSGPSHDSTSRTGSI